MSNTENNRYGTCPVCFQTVACTERGHLVRHGWQEAGGRRRGEYGRTWHTGPCCGSVAFENSAVQTWQAVEAAQRQFEALLSDQNMVRPNSREEWEHRHAIRAVCDYIGDATQRALAWHPHGLPERATVDAAEKKARHETAQKRSIAAAEKRVAKEQRVQERKAARAEALTALEVLVLESPVGTVWTYGQLKKLTGASEGVVNDFITGKLCRYGRQYLCWARDTSEIVERQPGWFRYQTLEHRVERIQDTDPNYDHFKPVEEGK